MSSTFSSLKFELIGNGEQSGTWGTTTNVNIGTAIEQAIVGMATLDSGDFTANVCTLTLSNTNAAQDARALCLDIAAGAVSAAGTINVPAIEKPYLIINGSSFAVTVKVSGQTGVAVPAGTRTVVYNNGTDVGTQLNWLGSLTLGTALPIASGGTGQTTAAAAITALTGTQTSGQYLRSNGTNAVMSAIQAADVPTLNQNTTGTAGNVSGTVAIANGGTGATTAANARTALSAQETLVSGTNIKTVNGTSLLGSGNIAVVAAPAGSSTQVQFNTAGALGASADLTFNGATLQVNGIGIGRGAGNDLQSTVVGNGALPSITSGTLNTAIGFATLNACTTGTGNTAVGATALDSLSTANWNVGVGAYALSSIAGGDGNVAVGADCMGLAVGSGNTAMGNQALRSVSGADNVAIGVEAGFSLSTGQSNVFIGSLSGYSHTTGSNNIAIGLNAGPSTNSVSNTITLGNSSITTLRCQVTTITSLSDARDKTDLKLMGDALNLVRRIQPMHFTWNMRDGGKVGEEDTGFIAQQLLSAQEQTGLKIPGLVDETNPDKLEAGYGKLIPVLVKALQQLDAEFQAYKLAHP